MNTDIQGALNQINSSFMHIRHRGKHLSKEQVRTVLEYGLAKGYKVLSEFDDNEVDEVLKNNYPK